MKTLTWQKPGQQNVAQELIKIIINYVAELRDHISRKQTITVRLLSITEAEYRYLKALNCLDDGDYDNTLMEPISLPCNVIGGLGFVGVCSESRVIIELPETVWQ